MISKDTRNFRDTHNSAAWTMMLHPQKEKTRTVRCVRRRYANCI